MRQTTDSVLMIRPAAFRSNPETAASNAFQDPEAMAAGDAQTAALAEFDAAAGMLRDANVGVCIVDDEPDPPKPDAIFPNNWISTHSDGTVVLYPMYAPSRRIEVRRHIVERLQSEFEYRIGRVLDLSGEADQGRFLEGTGSMVLDRAGRVAYACRSVRTDPAVLDKFCAELGYEPVLFDAVDAGGTPVYHTNVMMWIGERIACVCFEAVRDGVQRDALYRRLAATGREILELDAAQMAAFAGNMLALDAGDGALVVMSSGAHASLRQDQRNRIAAHARPLVVDIGAIETCSGGSIRCMLAELFL